MKLIKLGLSALVVTGTLLGATFEVDKSHSYVGFKVRHMMISNVKGSFDKFDGTFEYDIEKNRLKSLVGEIDVNSINTKNEKRDEHLKAPDIFNAKKYPTINFKLDRVEDGYAYGKLTMHGVTKDVKLEFENNGAISNRGKVKAGFSLYGTISRKDYGITWNKILEAGGVAVSDEVKLEIEIEGDSKN